MQKIELRRIYELGYVRVKTEIDRYGKTRSTYRKRMEMWPFDEASPKAQFIIKIEEGSINDLWIKMERKAKTEGDLIDMELLYRNMRRDLLYITGKGPHPVKQMRLKSNYRGDLDIVEEIKLFLEYCKERNIHPGYATSLEQYMEAIRNDKDGEDEDDE